MPEHINITDPQIHEPKDISNATIDQVYVSDGAGSGAWEDKPVPTGFDYTIETLIDARSVADTQIPIGPDTALQIEFGTGSATPSVDLDNLGNLQFVQAGSYFVNISLQFGRTLGATTSHIHFRALKNGSQVGSTSSVTIETAEHIDRKEFSVWIPATAGDAYTFEIIQDSSGHASGGLLKGAVTVGGWAISSTASMIVQRFT